MTAHRKAVARKPTPRRLPAPAPQSPSRGWPGVVRYALDSNVRTARLCVIIFVAGVVWLR